MKPWLFGRAVVAFVVGIVAAVWLIRRRSRP
jgi:hypothetical protein